MFTSSDVRAVLAHRVNADDELVLGDVDGRLYVIKVEKFVARFGDSELNREALLAHPAATPAWRGYIQNLFAQ